MSRSIALTNDRASGHTPGCPVWCAKDHLLWDTPGLPRIHFSTATEIWPGLAMSPATVRVYALTSDAWHRPGRDRVSIGGYFPPTEGVDWRDRLPSLHLARLDAEDLATIIGMLAGATPDQLRTLARGIRDCSELIKDTSSGTT